MPAILTEAAINAATRRAAALNERVTLADPGHTGLQMRITPNGTRRWVLYCRDTTGRPRRFPLGAFPELGVAQARRAASAMREHVRQGADPIAAARQKRAEAQASQQPAADTLRTLIALYKGQKGGRLRTWAEYQRRIESVFAEQLDTALSELRLGALQLQADRWPSAKSAAAAIRYLRPILRWAAAPGRAYVAKELTELTPPVSVARRDRVLSRDELARLLPVLARPGNAYAAAMMLMLLTLGRLQEVGGMTWREVDLAQATWTLPRERTKSDRGHVVPLSRQACALLRTIQPHNPDPDALVLTSVRGNPLGTWHAVTQRLMAESGTSGWHRHDLRRTGATLLGEMGTEPHIVEAALNHTTIHSPIASLYNRARYRQQVADALQRLADVLDGIVAGAATVVQLHRG